MVSDRGQDAGRNPMDVTGYVVQFKQPAQQEWSRANEKVFERSKRERERESF